MVIEQEQVPTVIGRLNVAAATVFAEIGTGGISKQKGVEAIANAPIQIVFDIAVHPAAVKMKGARKNIESAYIIGG